MMLFSGAALVGYSRHYCFAKLVRVLADDLLHEGVPRRVQCGARRLELSSERRGVPSHKVAKFLLRKQLGINARDEGAALFRPDVLRVEAGRDLRRRASPRVNSDRGLSYSSICL